MKKILSLITVFVIVLSHAAPVAAANSGFTPSVEYKDGPVIEDAVIIKPSPKPDEDKPDEDKPDEDKPDEDKPGEDKPGEDKPGEDKPDHERHDVRSCLVITSVPQARKKTTDIEQKSRDELIHIYDSVSDGSMKLPIKDYMVIRELVDISFQQTPCVQTDHSHREDLKREDTTVTVVLNLNIKPNVEVVVLTYVNSEWVPIAGVQNNNDGTITCTFENEGPVAFCVPQDGSTTPPQTGDAVSADLTLWIILLIVSLVAMGGLMVYRRKAVR